MEKKLTCISCPLGCSLVVKVIGDEIKVTGNTCSRGEIYGREEALAPKRVVTAVVRVNSKEPLYIPVKTDKPLLKEKINLLLKQLYSMKVSLPVKRGDLLIKNYNDSGVNLVFTRSMK